MKQLYSKFPLEKLAKRSFRAKKVVPKLSRIQEFVLIRREFYWVIIGSFIGSLLLVLTKPMRITYFSNIVFKSNLCYSIKKNFDLFYQRRNTQNDWIKFQQTPTLYLLKPSSISCSRTSYRQSFQRRCPHFDAKRYLAIYRGQ